eukprot:gene1609-18263_t
MSGAAAAPVALAHAGCDVTVVNRGNAYWGAAVPAEWGGGVRVLRADRGDPSAYAGAVAAA